MTFVTLGHPFICVNMAAVFAAPDPRRAPSLRRPADGPALSFGELALRKVMTVVAAVAVIVVLAGCTTTAVARPPAAAMASASPVALSPSTSASPPSPTPSQRITPVPGSPRPSGSRTRVTFGYSRTANSPAEVAAARSAAKADGREVLLDFGASWCGNCVAMDHDFRTAPVQAVLASSYHLVQIDIGDNVDANMRLLRQYDTSGSYGLPVLIILGPSGTIRVDTNKSGNPGFDQGSFLAFLKRWAA